MNKNHLKILTAGILSTVLLGVSTPAIALETPKTATQSTEADQPVSVSNTQQDSPWGLDRIDQRTLPLDGQFTTEADAGKGVSIYVVDSGFNSNHNDFTGRMDEGWSVADGNDTSPCNYHGTHVAGIAAGSTYGVAKSATIIPVRIRDSECKIDTDYVTAGLKWVKEHHQEGVPAVVNISLAEELNEQADLVAIEDLEIEIKSLIDDGITVVTGAGNDIADACNFSPARVPEIITVAASNRDDTPWIDDDVPGLGTNFGSCVDIYAPGKDILSAVEYSNNVGQAESGTSMASPHVAGAAAVILSRNHALTPAQVATEIMNTSTESILTNIPTGTPNRLLFLSETTAPPAPPVTAPWSPSNVIASTGTTAGRANIQWIQGNDGGSAIISQKIHIYENNIKRYTATVGAQSNNVNVGPLPEGKTYTFSVTATNAVGTSPESERSQPVKIPSATPTAPEAPSNVEAYNPSDTSASIVWTNGPDNGSPLTSHTVNVYKDNALVNSVEFSSGETSIYEGKTYAIIFDLEDGQTYTFSVTATNAVGASPESIRSAPLTIVNKVAPDAPTNPRAYARTGAADVFWDASSDNGSAITSYEITAYNGANVVKTVTVPAWQQSVKISGLYNGTNYHFTVKAISSAGISAESIASNTINPLVAAPGVATNVRAVARDNAADIYWTRGAENGAPFIEQIVTVYSGTTLIKTVKISGEYSSRRILNLTEGGAYNFTITEVNKMGSSPESATTTSVKIL